MNLFWQSFITTFVVPALTAIIKHACERNEKKIPMPVKILLPVVLGAVTQTGIAGAAGSDPLTGAALGAMAGGLASSGRDLWHKGFLGEHTSTWP